MLSVSTAEWCVWFVSNKLLTYSLTAEGYQNTHQCWKPYQHTVFGTITAENRTEEPADTASLLLAGIDFVVDGNKKLWSLITTLEVQRPVTYAGCHWPGACDAVNDVLAADAAGNRERTSTKFANRFKVFISSNQKSGQLGKRPALLAACMFSVLRTVKVSGDGYLQGAFEMKCYGIMLTINWIQRITIML